MGKRRPMEISDYFKVEERETMRRVVVESPFAGDVKLNTWYARAALADSLRRGEAPIASHLLYTQPGVLDDTDPAERNHGIRAGFRWGELADAVVVYTDLGVSSGMKTGIAYYRMYCDMTAPIEYRSLGGGMVTGLRRGDENATS